LEILQDLNPLDGRVHLVIPPMDIDVLSNGGIGMAQDLGNRANVRVLLEAMVA
jgi:hypothetical protein